MNQPNSESGFPTLFSHANREDWGVSVLSGESDGKRRYLFEGGEERTMAAGALDLMKKIAQPDAGQRATYARLVALLAKREHRGAPAAPPGARAVDIQLERFRKLYSGGFFGDEWKSGVGSHAARRARIGLVGKAQALCSKQALGKLVKAQQFETIWTQAIACVADSELSADGLRPTAVAEERRTLAEGVNELLHGSESYERRFDRFISVYESVFRDPPTWAAATALPALVSPIDQVVVAPAAFRKQLKALSRYSSFGARPNGAVYARCLAMTKMLANMLAARGEVPRDLLDVHDFIIETAAASPKPESKTAPA